jgi:hypothetical protein
MPSRPLPAFTHIVPPLADRVDLSHKHRPQLLSNADIRNSPWISAIQLEVEGLLVLWARERTNSIGRIYRRPKWRHSNRGFSAAPS